MNDACKRLEKLVEKHPDLKGSFCGYKRDRGGLGISRIDNDWHECDSYHIDADDLARFLESLTTDSGKEGE